ncbi:putative alginate lyase [Klebsiella pneumoniae]|uniref:Zinc-type alcohol dehydrogenase-like protein n=1 Tax=Klebsiella pneumoniae TaxID=573 RepID=A0A2X3F3H6_KLEPN|nr:putative alginate lyase [Klebsiella pneumoniae]
MKAVGFWQPGESTSVIEDLSLPHPSMPKGRDLLIRVRAVAVNPRDLKSRRNISPSAGNPVVMGYDASGVVEATGPDVTLFRPGDHVFYAGVLDRQGANAEFQLVDERITGIKPAALSFEAAASVPLTGLTAWEMLFDRLQLSVNGDADQTLLMLGGAGGVPCMAIQLARTLSRVNIIGTASRQESVRAVRGFGAHYVLDHSCALAPQVASLAGLPPITRIFSTYTTAICLGKYGRNYCPTRPYRTHRRPLNHWLLRLIKFKSVSVHWEAMFTRPMHATADMSKPA